MRTMFWLAIGICLLGAIGAIFWFTTSLHTFGVLAGQKQATSVLGSKGSNASLAPFTARLVQLMVPNESAKTLSAFSDWIYARGEDTEVIAGTSTEADSFPGWQVHTTGWLTTLTRTGTFDVSFQDVGDFFGIVFDAALGRVPIQPNILVDLKQQPGPISLIGNMRGQAFYFAYSVTGQVKGPLLAPHSFPKSIESLKVALPSSFLSKVSIKERSVIENTIVAELGLTKARPDLFKVLASAEVFGLEQAVEEGTAIGFAETNNEKRAVLIQEMTGWIALERGYTTPVTRAFRLPDGTIGYEYIPDSTKDDGLSVAGSDGCQISYIGDHPVWMCQKEGVVTLGTSQSITRNVQDDLHQATISNRWHIFLPALYAAALPSAVGVSDAAALEGVYITGDADTGEGMLLFRQQ